MNVINTPNGSTLTITRSRPEHLETKVRGLIKVAESRAVVVSRVPDLGSGVVYKIETYIKDK